MSTSGSELVYFLAALIYLAVVFMHLSKKNSTAITLYMLQALVVIILALRFSVHEAGLLLWIALGAMLIVKVVIAPYAFFKLIKQNRLTFFGSTYLNVPLTLIVLTLFTLLSYSMVFEPLVGLANGAGTAAQLFLATIFISIFLIINRKGVLSQILGVLALENGIVAFAVITGLEQSPALQLGILFDIFVWIVIASIFATMVYKQFGSFDVTTMKSLKEE